jgi:hypothetical protein
MINNDGSNSWVNNPHGRHTYVVQKMPADQIAKFIEDRMMQIALFQSIKKHQL